MADELKNVNFARNTLHVSNVVYTLLLKDLDGYLRLFRRETLPFR